MDASDQRSTRRAGGSLITLRPALPALLLCLALILTPPVAAQTAGETALKSADMLASAGKHTEAAALLEKFILEQPAAPELPAVRLKLANSLMALGRHEAAGQHLDKALEAKPPEALLVELLLTAGKAWTQAGQRSRALERLKTAFEKTEYDDRLGPVVGLLLGDLFAGEGRDAEAVPAYFRVTRWPAHESAPAAYFRMGQAYSRLKNHLEAALAFRNVPEKYWRHPQAPEAGLLAAEAYVSLNRLDEAEREFRRVLKDYIETPAAPRAQLGLGRIASLRGQYAVARSAFQAASVVFAASGIGPEADLRIAETYRAEKNLDEAVQRLTRLVGGPDRAVAGEAGLLLAELHGERKQAAEARTVLRAVSDDPRTGRWGHLAALRLADELAADGQAVEAIVVLRTLASRSPEPPLQDRARLQLGVLLNRTSQPAAAQAEFTALIAARPGSPEAAAASIELAHSRLLQGDAPDAVRRLQQSLATPLDAIRRPRALYLLGEAHSRANAPAAAVPLLKEVLEKHPEAGDAGPAALLLRDLYRAQKQETLVAELDRLIAAKYAGAGMEAAGLLAEAERALAAGKTAEAMGLFRRVLDRAPGRDGRVAARRSLAILEAAVGKDSEVEALLAALAQDSPPAGLVAETWARSGHSAAGAGKTDLAVRYWKRALEAGADPLVQAECRAELGLMDLRAGRFDEGREAVASLLRQQPAYRRAPELRYALAWEWLRQGKRPEASAEFRSLVEGSPSHALAADAAYRLGELAEAAGDAAEAEKHYRRAAADGRLPAASYRLGWLARHRGDHAEARREFLKAITSAETGVALESRVRAGEACLELDRGEEAGKLFQAVLDASPATLPEGLGAAARTGLATALLMTGDFDRARATAADIAASDPGFYGARAALVVCEAIFLKEGPARALPAYAGAAGATSRFPDIAAEAGFRAGECLAKMGDRAGARRRWVLTAALHPETSWATLCRERAAQPEPAANSSTPSRK